MELILTVRILIYVFDSWCICVEVFKIHHKDRLSDFGVNDKPGAISNDLTQTLTFLLGSLIVTPQSGSFRFLSFSWHTSNCLIVAFPPLRNSDHVIVWVSIEFPSNSKVDVPYPCPVYVYSDARWERSS